MSLLLCRNENSSECAVTALPAAGGKRLYFCRLSQTQLFVPLDIRVFRDDLLIHNRSLFIEVVCELEFWLWVTFGNYCISFFSGFRNDIFFSRLCVSPVRPACQSDIDEYRDAGAAEGQLAASLPQVHGWQHDVRGQLRLGREPHWKGMNNTHSYQR